MMRWPRFLRRRRNAPPWVEKLPTFHHEPRIVETCDGPMEVRVPVLDDGTEVFPVADMPALYGNPPPQPDLRVVQCNYAVGTKVCAAGARAYVLLTNPGGASDRIHIMARSRGGRFVERWEDIRRLRDFRPKTIPPEHPLYGDLWVGYDDAAKTAAHLSAARTRENSERPLR